MHSEAPATPVSPDSIAAGHESSTVGVKGFIIFVVVLVAFGLFIHLTIWGLMVGFAFVDSKFEPVLSPVERQKPTPPAPWLQPSPPQGIVPRNDWQDLAELRDQEHMTLTTYGKDDATGGVRIPVARAMELLVSQKKLPVSNGAAGRASLAPAMLPAESSSEPMMSSTPDSATAPATMKAPNSEAGGGQ